MRVFSMALRGALRRGACVSAHRRWFLILCLLLPTVFVGFPSSVFGADRGAINSGETVTGTIVGPTFVDAFQFSGNAGDTVIINAVARSGDLDTFIDLYSPSGIKEADSRPWYDQLSWKLNETGTYTILVSDYGLDGAGTYSITFQKIPGAVSSAGDPDGGLIASGQTMSGTIVASDMDAFQFSGNAGDTVIITAGCTSGDLDIVMDLYSPTGNREQQADTGEQMSVALAETGTYTIILSDSSLSESGTYSISLNPRFKVTLWTKYRTPLRVNQRVRYGGTVSPAYLAEGRRIQVQW